MLKVSKKNTYALINMVRHFPFLHFQVVHFQSPRSNLFRAADSRTLGLGVEPLKLRSDRCPVQRHLRLVCVAHASVASTGAAAEVRDSSGHRSTRLRPGPNILYLLFTNKAAT